MCGQKTVNVKQLTVVWHVDDLKISHVKSDEVDEMIAQLSKKQSNYEDLAIHIVKVHE